jgi:TolA-binding protein
MLVYMIRRSTPGVFLLAIAVLSAAPTALAQNPRTEIETLKKQLEELQHREGETKRQLEELQRRLDVLQSQPVAPEQAPADKLEQAIQELPKAPTPPTTSGPGLTASGGYDLSAHRHRVGRPGCWRGLNRGRRRTTGTAG